MGFLKYSGDNLFDGHQLLGAGKVLIMSADGRVDAVIDRAEAGDDVQYRPGILSPGLVNAHCHLELSHLKGLIPEKTGMVNFLLGVIETRQAETDAILQAISDAEEEMLGDGIVAVGDICNTAHSFEQKGQQRLQYYNFIEATGFVPGAAGSRYEAALALLQSAPGPASVVPHAPYSVSPQLFERIFKRQQQVVSMHSQESAAENELFATGRGDFLHLYQKLGIDISFFTPSGKSSLQSVWSYFKNTVSVLLVHNCHTGLEDITELVNGRTDGLISCCLCPNANLYIGNPLPGVDLLLRSGINICLGTDSLASNHQLSIQAEMATIKRHYPHVPLADILQWATLNGAKALGMEEDLGSFEAEKRPGVVWVENPGFECNLT